MNRLVVIFLGLLFSVFAGTSTAASPALSKLVKNVCEESKRWSYGVLTGIDIGAAVPWPPTAALGSGDKMEASPSFTPSIGLLMERPLRPRWSLNFTPTYKTVTIDATLLTLETGQIFKDGEVRSKFMGKASTYMSFSMLEMPLFVKYEITPDHRAFLGAYFAWILRGRFTADAIQGVLQNLEDPTAPLDVISPESPLHQDFSPNLDHWDAGLLCGYEYRINQHLGLEGRFSVGFKDVFKPGENYLDYQMWHMRGSIVLTYTF